MIQSRADGAHALPGAWVPLLAIPPKRFVKGIVVALASFVILGTVTALWRNPFFVRMSPAGAWEIGFLALLSLQGGLYAAVRLAACGGGTAGTGGVVGFLGIACPVCNKVLLLLFGSQVLLTYLDPVRIYVAAGGSLLLAAAILLEYRRQRALLGQRLVRTDTVADPG